MDSNGTLISRLAEATGALGVPASHRELAAWVVIYLAVVLVAAVLILVLLRIRRRPAPPAPPAGDQPPSVSTEPPVRPEQVPSASPLVALQRGLAKTSSSLVGRIEGVLRGRSGLTTEIFEELEEILVTADVGVTTTQAIIQALEERFQKNRLASPEALREALREEIRARVQRVADIPPEMTSSPHVIMMVGVNGVGKTTTIGKLAQQWTRAGKRVILGAADTFRAAAAEQLAVWAERSGAELVRQGDGSDPGAVAYDAAQAARARAADILILDTAGRLHTKTNLMEELKKVQRVLGREIPGAPHETLLVLDASTGQNALAQARQFHEAVAVSGLVLTKLDGTAKGGVVLAIGQELGLPVRFIGIGEGVDDLRPFDPDLFVAALFPDPSSM